MGYSGDLKVVVTSNRYQTPNRWWLPLIATVTNIYKPWVLRQKICGVSPMQCKFWTFWWWGRLLVGCYSFHLLIFALGIRGGWEVWPVKRRQTWKTTIMNIARPILAYLKETCFLPDLSITCTAKAKAVMVKKQLSMLKNSWIFNQVGPGGSKYCNKAAPTANSVKNLHARPAGIPWDNHLPWLGS